MSGKYRVLLQVLMTPAVATWAEQEVDSPEVEGV